ncbi:MAG: tRNA 2-thiouridine(34) synthase MnmA [Firmicutes bacterium]|nr:tRNA 2-thiouridine(34) synthase MnmA [Bacillota bacterium]
MGLSGGVDSSVAAKLLLEQDYNVIGLFMHNWEEDDGSGNCTATTDWQDAQAVASKLGIPCYSLNFSKEYTERVFSYFLEEYKRGRTPNPDVLCNREIKFGPFSEYAKKLGADFVATGHYCGIKHKFTIQATSGRSNDTYLMRAVDTSKDQTYFLNQVRTEQLSNVIFPLANLPKSEVRAIAEKERLITARKKDSTGICFIGERKFREFLKTYLPAIKGDIVDKLGRILGTHDGLMYYTLGQRKGFGLGGVKGENANRWYVVEKNLEKNWLVVSNGEGEELFSRELTASNINYIGEFDYSKEYRATAKCRYSQVDEPCTVTHIKDNLGNITANANIVFDNPQRAITAGQFVVLYNDNRCLGGGVIE